jgi:transposase-like protein
MITCPKCSNEMELLETDSRQEWFEEEYYCKECNKYFTRRVEFEPQSNIIARDEVTEKNGK